jgi:hypothetical protein
METGIFKRIHQIVILLLIVASGHAQLVISPAAGPKLSQSQAANARMTAKVVKLPFFDDFSTTKTDGSPDVSLWQKGGGVFVSNTLTTDHPTTNVVAFDGVDAKGNPYNFSTSKAEGPADSLTSQPIDMSGLTPATDAIYFSFYWRAKGLSEKPDPTDTLKLQFLDVSGKWRTVWNSGGGAIVKVTGKDTTRTYPDKFTNHFIAIEDKAFLYSGFQFRFLAYGRISGRFDTWYLDYVYLGTKRAITRRVQDVACRLPVTPFLKRYSAMPIKQYFAKPAAETADSVLANVFNLDFVSGNFTSHNVSISDKTNGQVFQNELVTSSVIFPLGNQNRGIKVKPLPDLKAKEMVIVSKVVLNTSDGTDPNISIPGVNLKQNDTIVGENVLSNYYAYDDGTAEYTVYMNKPFGRTAVRFDLNQPDTIVAVQLNINPILTNIEGQPFTILVWDDDNGKPGNIIAQQSFKVKYPATRNGFTNFEFDYGVPVRNTVYVGWLQISQDYIGVGLDKNYKRENKIFTNTSREWVAYSDTKKDSTSTLASVFEGVPMLRVVVGSKILPPNLRPLDTNILATEPATTDNWAIYPNPTNGLLNWKGEGVQQVTVMGLTGSVLLDTKNITQKSVDLSELPSGQYIIRLSNERKSLVKKVIKY